MKLELKLELSNLYGGDGNLRYEIQRQEKLKRSKKRTTTKMEVSSTAGIDEELFEEKKIPINTFAQNKAGKYTYRLADKMKGVLRQAGELYADETGEISKAACKRILATLFVMPQEVELEKVGEITQAELPQLLNTMGRNTMIIQHFDVIEKCQTSCQLIYPDNFNKQVMAFLRRLEMLPFGNRRKGQIKILSGLPNGKQ